MLKLKRAYKELQVHMTVHLPRIALIWYSICDTTTALLQEDHAALDDTCKKTEVCMCMCACLSLSPQFNIHVLFGKLTG